MPLQMLSENEFKDEMELQQVFEHPYTKQLVAKVEELNELKDISKIKIPYVIKNKILMSPGVWNGKYYDFDSIKKAFSTTSFTKKSRSLFWDHEDASARTWIGEVQNIQWDAPHVKGDLVIVDDDAARKLAFGAKFGISPRLRVDEQGDRILSFLFENFSVVLNPAVKTAYINNAQQLVEEKSEVSEMNDKELEEFIAAKITEALKKKKEEYPEPEKCAEYDSEELQEAVEALKQSYRAFIKDYLDKHKGSTIADAAKAWKKVEHAEDEYSDEEMRKKKYPYPEEKEKEKEKYPEEEKEKKYPYASGGEELKNLIRTEIKNAVTELSQDSSRKSVKTVELREAVQKLSVDDKAFLINKYLLDQRGRAHQ